MDVLFIHMLESTTTLCMMLAKTQHMLVANGSIPVAVGVPIHLREILNTNPRCCTESRDTNSWTMLDVQTPHHIQNIWMHVVGSTLSWAIVVSSIVIVVTIAPTVAISPLISIPSATSVTIPPTLLLVVLWGLLA